MTPQEQVASGYVKVAEAEVDSVRPARGSFVLEGRGADRADYRLELLLEIPVDEPTRRVVGELLTQCQWRLSRKLNQPIKGLKTGVRRPSRA